MYDDTDPRSTLAATARPRPESGEAIAAPQYFDFRELSAESRPSVEERTAVVRGQNVILIHTFARPGDQLDNGTLDNELAVVATAGSPAFDVVTAEGSTRVEGAGLVVVPPGSSHISVLGEGPLVRLVEAGETTWSGLAANAGSYEQHHPRVALLERWPTPPGGNRVRVYPLSKVADEPGRFGRIFRTRSFMVNFLPESNGPRDPKKLSPHTHDDFEQLSLAVQGEFFHHIRTPWLGDSTAWRDDDHVRIGSPSAAIIPPPTVHTSEAYGPGVNQLVDIFSPPRVDFSEKPGWVLNADDYPMP
jgi:hypothetical protein